ncbi:conserved hypothetical protein [Delftia phage PhiW-14]|uniref:Uncharacterized protein n=1 Tax=Delftia phage PhiW-14 TaxID=665032 RepID=C9DG57_BPW14|nr:hypothetical protein DP-phiW-14_gp087 [Delftia phage PhiW-14]ACV50108.1 conserved hypothetical protein [Delftia phage PhiW-14]
MYTVVLTVAWVIGVCIYEKHINWLESFLQLGAATVVGLVFSLTLLKLGDFDAATYTTPVTAKEKRKVGCEHSYTTCTGSGDKQVCVTNYEHAWDIDWVLVNELGDIRVNRVDRRGLKEPPRFTKAQVGDPVSDTKMYTNYISAAPGSLFNLVDVGLLINKYAGLIPAYPQNVYDYHYMDKVLAVNFTLPEQELWNRGLDNMLKTMSMRKNVNIINVFIKGQPQEYADALAAKWYGGKHNDVLVVTGVSEWPEIEWVRVISWSDSELFKVQLRDKLEGLHHVDRDQYLAKQAMAVEHGYVHKNNKDFEYLKGMIDVPLWKYVMVLSINFLVNLAITVFRVRRNRPRGYRY